MTVEEIKSLIINSGGDPQVLFNIAVDLKIHNLVDSAKIISNYILQKDISFLPNWTFLSSLTNYLDPAVKQKIIEFSNRLAQKNYFIKENYTIVKNPDYYIDVQNDSDIIWQPEVYYLAYKTAKKYNIKNIIDIGCGRGRKLNIFKNQFNIIGVDYGENINFCKDNYNFGTWIEFDLNSFDLLNIEKSILENSLIICSDIIEHLTNPVSLLFNLKFLLENSNLAFISTPERDLVRGYDHNGPPDGAFHVREWNKDEFEKMLNELKFEVEDSLLSINNNKDLKRQTILSIVSGTGKKRNKKYNRDDFNNYLSNLIDSPWELEGTNYHNAEEKVERKYVIVSGFYEGEQKTTNFSISKKDFLDIWYKNTVQFCNPTKIYVINVSNPIDKKYANLEFINMTENLGHVNDFVKLNDTHSLSGYTLSVLIGMLVAYNNKADFIYKEQDCLAFGNWVDELYNELEEKGNKMLIGKGHMDGFIEQSLFICKNEFILPFISLYLNFMQGDYPLLPEYKFLQIMQNNPALIGFLDFGYGRIRPVNYQDSVFYVQQLNDEEIQYLENTGMIKQQKIKVNFGCGSNRIPGWINHDMDVDITKKLPYENGSVDMIFAEHVVEHLTIHEAYNFFEECYRILKRGGAIRITLPSITNIYSKKTPEYIDMLYKNSWGDNSEASAVKSIIFNHGHQSAWDEDILITFLANIGFEARPAHLYKSKINEFNGVEGHQKVIGNDFNTIESISVEGFKYAEN